MVTPADRGTWDKRADGSAKGLGFLGLLQRPDGNVSSEISAGINVGGKEMDVPLMIPGLTKPEMDYLMTNEPDLEKNPAFFTNMPRSILSKAEAFAKQRLAQGKSPFRQDNEVDDPAPSARPVGDADYQMFKRAIIGQETGGRYGVTNTQGSGAAGVGQVMPTTTQSLAARLGLPYRPDLMTGTGDEAKRYQDAITDAAVKEAWGAGGGGRDPRTSAMYYFGGSDRDQWGRKTRAYGDDIMARLRALRGY